MDRYPYEKPPRWWSPRPSRRWVRFWRPLRRYQQRRQYRVAEIEVEGLEHLAASVSSGQGVLVTPNHAGHADSYLLLDALERLPCNYYIMTAWQVFALMGPTFRLAYQHHGCFSVDREATDLKAYRQCVDVLARSSEPLVIFPEGEVFHLNDRVKPFRAGLLSIAATAMRRGGRPLACVPCGLKYQYLADPTPELLPIVERIEQSLGVGRGPATLADRMESLTAAVVQWRERQYLGEPQSGPLRPRIDSLADTILERLERRYHLDGTAAGADVPDRVKALRQQVIGQAQRTAVDEAALEDAFAAMQLYSYAPGYVAERPTIERIAETVDKLEEDILGVRTATIRGQRRGTIRFGEPLRIDKPPDREAMIKLRPLLEQRLQHVLDQMV